MPYRRAWLWVLAVFPLAGLAFWPQYLSKLATASPEFHAHGITAALWLLLLVAQSWSIHAGRVATHRTLGASSLILLPLFMAGGAAIFVGMADRAAAGSPFHAMYGHRLAWLDVSSVVGMAWFYFEGLRSRRDMQRHSRWLLATVIFLLPPILGRLAPILPPLAVTGPQDFPKLGAAFQVANAATASVALVLALRAGRHGAPFYAAALMTAGGALAFQFVGPIESWRTLFLRFADVPWWSLAAAAGLFGAGVAWAGWTAGKAPVGSRAAAPA